MDDERRKAILLALACLATAALDLVLLAMCVRHIIRGGRK